MTPLLRARSQRIAAIVAGGLVFAIGFLPLFGAPGYEQSLACGVVLPSAAAIATALDVARGGREASWLAKVGRGVASGLLLAALGFAIAMVHGLRVGAMKGALVEGFCDLPAAARAYVLTAGMGAVMGGAWGVVAGECAVRVPIRKTRLACVLFALAAPIGGIVISVGRFYSSPIVFAFDPFFGYFSGTLYDTVIDAGEALVTYRVGSLCTLGAFAFAAAAASASASASASATASASASASAPASPSTPTPPPGPLPASREGVSCVALAMLCAAGSLYVTFEGAELGHWQTSATIAKTLRGFRAGARCDVVYPDGQREDQVALLVRDCEEELAHDEAWMGTRLDGRLTAFFFRDAGEKKRLMGAGDTYIAKPWRREVYLQLHSYPHPVLGHEVAHVVAGSMARGPFRIAGALGGWWPNPGLIEGIAVAASPDDEELTGAQWARAMKELGLLPPLSRVFSLGFLGESSAKSYTVAGAFVDWVRATYGGDVVKRWYGGAPIDSLTGAPLAAMDDRWRASLDAVPLSEGALAYAKARFDRPSVFGRTCPHVVDALAREANGCRDALQIDRARTLYGEVLARDPHDWGAMWGLGVMELRYADADRGARALAKLAVDADAPKPWRDRSDEAIADADFASDDPARWAAAGQAYLALATKTLDEDQGRTLEVKWYGATIGAATSNGEGRAALAALLVGEPRRPADADQGLARVAAWAARTDDEVALYVWGKNLVNHEMWREAGAHFDRALARGGEPTTRIARELLRQRVIVACALGDRDAARATIARVDATDGPFATSIGRRAWTDALVARCTGASAP